MDNEKRQVLGALTIALDYLRQGHPALAEQMLQDILHGDIGQLDQRMIQTAASLTDFDRDFKRAMQKLGMPAIFIIARPTDVPGRVDLRAGGDQGLYTELLPILKALTP